MKKSANLEFLRFFLAFWVFIAHILPWYTYSNSTVSSYLQDTANFFGQLAKYSQPSGALHPAVVGFLVLSGYVIATGFNEDKLKSNLTKYVREWGVRRLFRIMPVYVLGIVIGGGIFAILGNSNFKFLTGTQDVSVQCLANKAFSISSFIPTGYPNCAFQGNAPLVTTAAEVGLYLVFIPISILLVKGFYKATATLITIFWFSGNLAIAIFHESNYLLQWWTHASSINYLLPWFLGASLAFKNKKIYSNFSKALHMLFILFSTALVVLFFMTTNDFRDLYVSQLYLIIYSILFYIVIKFLVSVRQIGFIADFLGQISYTLYVIHAPVSIYMISKGLGFISILITNLLLSILLNMVVESPLRNLGRKIAHRL